MADAPEFPKLDSTTPQFWEVRYRADFTPWDAGGAPQQVQAFAAAQPTPLRVLVPGCGSGYEIVCFAQAGWDVTGIDFSPAAVERARQQLGAHGALVEQADFFALPPTPPFDLVYERTFLCALKPNLRAAYAHQVAQLLVPGGRLCGYFYYDDKSGGPPFAITQPELEVLLTPQFERVETLPVPDSLPIFQGKERWEVWRKRG